MARIPSHLADHGRLRPRRTLPLAALLVSGVGSLLVLIGGLTAWQVSRSGEAELRQREHERLGIVAQLVAGELARTLDDRQTDLRDLRDLLGHDHVQSSLAVRRAVLDRHVDSHPQFAWIGLVDGAGRVELASHGLSEGLDVSGSAWFEAARNRGNLPGTQPDTQGAPQASGPTTPRPQAATGNDAPLADLAVAVRSLPAERGSSADVAGVLAARISTRRLDEAIRRALGRHAGHNGLAVAVVDPRGHILVDSGNTSGVVDTLASTTGRGVGPGMAQPGEPERAGAPPRAGDLLELGWPGEDAGAQLAVLMAVPAGELAERPAWRVVARSSLADLQRGVADMRLRAILVCLGVGLLFMLGLVWLARRTTRSLQHLVDDMREFSISSITPEARPASHVSEVALLNRTLRATMHQVVMQRHSLKESQRQVVMALARASAYRDSETGLHVLRMSHCAGYLAKLAGLPQDQVEHVRLAAQLHDIGKIGIPDAVLLKPGRFDEAELGIVRRHPEIGAGILAGFDAPLLAMARTVALTHHERWDGGGYPRGLAGEAIPQAGRIVTLCDVFDALLSSRSYKTGWPLQRVRDLLREQAGKHFDPRLTELLLCHMDDFVRIRAGIDSSPWLNAEAADDSWFDQPEASLHPYRGELAA